jgi:hypothetical protein
MIELAPVALHRMTFDDAVLYCQFLDYNGYRDWRLPTTVEFFAYSSTGLVASWFSDDDDHVKGPNTIYTVMPVRDI